MDEPEKITTPLKKTKSFLVGVTVLTVLVGFAVTLGVLLYLVNTGQASELTETLLIGMVGNLIAAFNAAIFYAIGGSRGSDNKTDLLAQAWTDGKK